MKAPRYSLACAATLLLLSGCAATPPASSDETTTSASHASDPTDAAIAPEAGGGGTYGCTPAMISFMDANGYADPTPADPMLFTFPEAAAPSVRPACYVEDDFGGPKRKGAIFTGDSDATIAQIGATLTAAGYQQNSGYGANIWWLDGDDPSSARYAVGAGPQPVDGQTVVWVTWASD